MTAGSAVTSVSVVGRFASWDPKCLLTLSANAKLPRRTANKKIIYCYPVNAVLVYIRDIDSNPLSQCPPRRSAECPAPAPGPTTGGGRGAQDVKKGSENEAVADLRRRLPVRPHLPHRRPHHHHHHHHRRPPLPDHHVLPAAVEVALAVVTPAVNPESSPRNRKRRNTKKRGRKRSVINVKKTRNQKEKRTTLDLYRSPST